MRIVVDTNVLISGVFFGGFPRQILNAVVESRLTACAKDAKALYIVSGDKDLLVLEKFENIEIITAKEFWEKYMQSY